MKDLLPEWLAQLGAAVVIVACFCLALYLVLKIVQATSKLRAGSNGNGQAAVDSRLVLEYTRELRINTGTIAQLLTTQTGLLKSLAHHDGRHTELLVRLCERAGMRDARAAALPDIEDNGA